MHGNSTEIRSLCLSEDDPDGSKHERFKESEELGNFVCLGGIFYLCCYRTCTFGVGPRDSAVQGVVLRPLA